MSTYNLNQDISPENSQKIALVFEALRYSQGLTYEYIGSVIDYSSSELKAIFAGIEAIPKIVFLQLCELFGLIGVSISHHEEVVDENGVNLIRLLQLAEI
ncbi:hypothetical protein [Neptuniibacter sp. QD37_11]|uniref:hypothetical protein n=1 Tax=Neptuniibacter sp. QD37_11 TaxID=3398209 RepID=UPI0039F603BD